MRDEKLRKELSVEPGQEKCHEIKNIVTAFVAGMNLNHDKIQIRDMLYALKQVKMMMDSEDYSLECDKLYDLVASTIEKYDK